MTTPTSPPPLYTTPAPVSPIPVLPAPPPRRRWLGCLGWSLFVLLLTILFLLLSYRRAPTARLPHNGVPIPLSEFTTRLEANQVRTLIVDRNQVRGEFVTAQSLPDASTPAVYFRTPLPEGLGESWPFLEWLLAHRGSATVHVDPAPNTFITNVLVPLFPWLLIFAFIWFFVFRLLRNQAKNPPPIITGPGRWVPDP